MPVQKKATINYYSILKHSEPQPQGGLLRHVPRDGEEQFYGKIEGILTGIELKKDDWQGTTVWKYHFKFENREHNMKDILQVGESSSAARGILQTLISCDEPIGWVSIAPYRKEHEGKTYTNVWMEVNGKEVEWKDEVTNAIPEVQVSTNKLGEEQVDDSARRMFFRKIAKNITHKKLAGAIVHEDGSISNYGASKDDFNGQEQAEAMHGDPEPEPSQQKKPSGNEVDMSDFEDIDDDLPF